MTVSPPERDRNVIPKWRDPASTISQGEIGAVLRTPDRAYGYGTEVPDLGDLEKDWRERGTLSFAADLVGSALVVGSSPDARQAAEFILSDGSGASPLARRVARQVLGTDDDEEPSTPSVALEVQERVQLLRQRLALDPGRTLAWTELARHFAAVGSKRRSERAMKVALSLDPDHRYVLRSAARLSIHNGDYRRAHDLVAASTRTKTDPWLMATEIAAAAVAQRRPRFVRPARLALESGSYLPHAVSELASALGTLELKAGNDRVAKRLFSQSLVVPNENAIAQGEWASQSISGLEVSAAQFQESAEARARKNSEQGRWAGAVDASWQWLDDQPFSRRPATLGSYQASIGKDFKAGVDFAERGLTANPDDFLLQNNLVFCLINVGETEKARKRFTRIKVEGLSQGEMGTYLATSGLLAFRSHQPERGLADYHSAIQLLRGEHRLIAQIMLTRELLVQQLPQAEERFAEVKEQGSRSSHPDVGLWLSHLPDD